MSIGILGLFVSMTLALIKFIRTKKTSKQNIYNSKPIKIRLP
jgi:hypothetical protein